MEEKYLELLKFVKMLSKMNIDDHYEIQEVTDKATEVLEKIGE